MKSIELAIDSDLSQVSLVAVAVHRVCLHLGLSEKSAGEVELCVAEAVTNAIRHAYRGAPGSRVMVALTAAREHILVDVCDRGTVMPAQYQQRVMHGANEADVQFPDRKSIPEGGRGLQIIRELMDQVSYSSDGLLNHLTMTKHLRESSEQCLR